MEECRSEGLDPIFQEECTRKSYVGCSRKGESEEQVCEVVRDVCGVSSPVPFPNLQGAQVRQVISSLLTLMTTRELSSLVVGWVFSAIASSWVSTLLNASQACLQPSAWGQGGIPLALSLLEPL